MIDLLQTWSSFYANHAAIRTLVAFVHVGALITGGGLAVSTDRAVLTSAVDDDWSHRSLLETLQDTHRLVVGSLVLITISGLLLFASDYETFLYSKFFWTKMALVALLLMNGLVLWSAERRASSGDRGAWRTLRATAIASITLWLLTTLGGVALPNIG
ncbi:MAG TPA: hypothetical protein VFA27_13435 [Vicinamibacterales bacterium]|nr:hypothetical protein [Vicinamibacterales bacterium]